MSKLNQILTVILLLLLANEVYAIRIPRPARFSLPWTKNQVSELNETLEDLWYLQQGEFNLDIVSTTKTNADNGDIWILTGAQSAIQYKSGDVIFTITP